MSQIEEARPQPVARRFASIATATVLLGLSGIFSGTQVACVLDHYSCQGKDTTKTCASHTPEACQMDSACEWRVGCASACQHATTIAECSAIGSCGVVQARCYGAGCTIAGAYIKSEQECSATACNWEPSCWDAPNSECSPSLDEAECTRRNCEWKREDASL